MEALRRADPGSGQCQLIRGSFVPLFGISTASLQRVGAAADAVPLCGQTGGGGDAAFIHPPLHFLSERERERGKRDAERETEGVEEEEAILGPGDMSACSLLPALPDGRSRS